MNRENVNIKKLDTFRGIFYGKSKYSVDFKLKAIKRYHKGDIGTDDLGKRIGFVVPWFVNG